MGAERFGEEEGKSMRTSYPKNHRVVRIHNIRQDIIALKSQYKKAGESEPIGLSQLMGFLQEKIRVLRRTEWHQSHHRERARRCADALKFTKELLGFAGAEAQWKAGLFTGRN